MTDNTENDRRPTLRNIFRIQFKVTPKKQTPSFAFSSSILLKDRLIPRFSRKKSLPFHRGWIEKLLIAQFIRLIVHIVYFRLLLILRWRLLEASVFVHLCPYRLCSMSIFYTNLIRRKSLEKSFYLASSAENRKGSIIHSETHLCTGDPSAFFFSL